MQLDRSLLEGNAIVNFRAAIRSEATRDPYERRLIHFLQWYGKGCDRFVADAKANPISMESKILKFIQEKKALAEKKIIAPATIGGFLKSVRLLLEMNDATLNWKKIRRTLPRVRRFALDRAPTEEEIRKTIENSDIRGKALTLFFITSGTREGAIKSLTVSDLTAIKKNDELVAGRVMIYRGDEEQYFTFITIEAYDAIQEYLKFRQIHGEKITADSPLFRDKFDAIEAIHYRKGTIHNANVRKPRPMSEGSIRKYYNYLFHQLGFRNGTKRRHEFSVHGFRKYFKTKCELQGMKPINVETLMGHSTGISDSYYRPTKGQLLEDYMKIAQYLTIAREKELQQQIESLHGDLEKKIEAAVRKQFEKAFELARQNPTLLNVKPEELGKLKPRQSN